MCITGQVDSGAPAQNTGHDFAFPAGEASGNRKMTASLTKANGVSAWERYKVLSGIFHVLFRAPSCSLRICVLF